MPRHDIIVIGASAGGVEALTELVGSLPTGIPAAIFVVLHIPAGFPSALPQILGRSTTLPVAHAVDGEPIVNGRVYVAPPDRHLLVRRDHVELAHGPMENRNRPAVDPLFRSAAAAYGPRVVGVVLTGALDDGTHGLLAIRWRGGRAIVQDPKDALYHGMPKSALEHVDVDHCVPLAAIPALLVDIATSPSADVVPDERPDEQTVAGNEAEAKMTYPGDEGERGVPSVIACPDCHGTLWEVDEDGLLRFRCRVGHAWSASNMVAAQNESTENALWAALRALEENAALARRMADRARERKSLLAERFQQRGDEAGRNAAVIRELLMKQTYGEPAAEADSEDIEPA